MFATPSGVLDELERAIDAAHASELPLELPRLRKLIDRLDALWLQQVRTAERAGALDETHAGPARVVAETCQLPFRQAARDVRAARALEALPVLAGAFAAGAAPAHHVRLVAAAVDPAQAGAIGKFDVTLTEWACQRDTRLVHAVIHRVRETISADRGVQQANDVYEQRRVHLSTSLDRVGFLDGQLDPEGTEYVSTAFEHRMEADPDTDGDKHRTRAQRRSDALVDICRHYLRTHHAEPPSGARRGQPHISGVVTVELLAAHATPAAVDHNELDFAGPIAADTWRRLSCDCSIHRIVMRGRRETLDLGRLTRTVPGPLWRALVARDKHCTHRGCFAPPAFCEAHHIAHWADGGPTNLANLRLLCWRHHRAHHEGQAPDATYKTRAGP